MADPNISVKISDLPGSGAMADTDVLPLARAGANYKVTGAQIKTYAATPAPAGSDTQVQFNDGGVLGADSGLTYNKATETLTVANVSGKASSVTPAGSDTQVQFNDGGISAGSPGLTFNKTTGQLASTKYNGAVACIQNIAAGDTTPSVSGALALRYITAANITITNFDDGTAGQVIFITNITSSNTVTITRDHVFTPSISSIVLNKNGVAGFLCLDGSIWVTLFVLTNTY